MDTHPDEITGAALAAAGDFTLILSHGPNPDVRGGYWGAPADPGRERRVPVASLAEASRALRAFVERNELGGGNMTRRTGTVLGADGGQVARVSYNGRVWRPGTR